MKKSVSVILLTMLLGAAQAATAAIVYISDNRIANLYNSYSTHVQTPSPAFSDFTTPNNFFAFEVGAYQNSSLAANGMSGTGSTYAGSDAMFYGAHGRSLFSVTFGVNQLSNFSLTGLLDGMQYDGTLSAKLFENGTEIFSTAPYTNGNFSLSGQMLVGNTYQLVLLSETYISDYYNETWQFNLATTPVPVPAAVWLLGSGLVGLLGVARRRRAI